MSEEGWEKSSWMGMLVFTLRKGSVSLRVRRRYQNGWQAVNFEASVEKFKKQSWPGRTGCTQRDCKTSNNYRRETTFTWNHSYRQAQLIHSTAQGDPVRMTCKGIIKTCVERCCEIANKTIEPLCKVFLVWMIINPKRKNWEQLENDQMYLLKSFSNVCMTQTWHLQLFGKVSDKMEQSLRQRISQVECTCPSHWKL